MACQRGMTVDRFCKSKSRHPVTGCPMGSGRPTGCCRARTARCRACKAGTTVDEFCKTARKKRLQGKWSARSMRGCPRTPGEPSMDSEDDKKDDKKEGQKDEEDDDAPLDDAAADDGE